MNRPLYHTTFGGVVYLSDFDTNHRGNHNSKGSSIARRIIADWSFDNQCIKNKSNKIRTWR